MRLAAKNAMLAPNFILDVDVRVDLPVQTGLLKWYENGVMNLQQLHKAPFILNSIPCYSAQILPPAYQVRPGRSLDLMAFMSNLSLPPWPACAMLLPDVRAEMHGDCLVGLTDGESRFGD